MKYKIVLWVLIIAYILYFSLFTILRMKTLYSSYFDLGIMHQTVFNTYRAITHLDFSRVLELTSPMRADQIKRIAIHNDIILAPLALFYFIYASPVTLLVIQAAVVGLGAWFIFKIAQYVFEANKYQDLFSLLFSLSYLLYPPLERANIFDFHAVTLATTLLLAMFYFWLRKSYGLSFLFLLLTLLTKEEIGLTTAFFGGFVIFTLIRQNTARGKKEWIYAISVIVTSILWFIFSFYFIIPYFRGGERHFALSYYEYFGGSVGKILLGVISNPLYLAQHLFNGSTWNYFLSLLGPVGFLSLLSPLHFIIAAPEVGINLLSSNPSLRSIYFHYSSVITPFIFISAIYGARGALRLLSRLSPRFIAFYLTFFILLFAYLEGPLPLARNHEIHPFKYPQKESALVDVWSDKLKDENLKISTVGQLSPFFTGRRYFYVFSQNYPLADYLVIRPNEIYNYPERESLIPAYKKLQTDSRFKMIYKSENFEVYKKL